MTNFKEILEFLIALQINNNRNWFKENNERYQTARKGFEHFVETLIPKLKQIDNSIDVTSSGDCVFRIFRDVRFSKNKEPYKTNFGAFISKGGRKSPYAGYYLHIEPDNSFVGGGIYMPEPPALKAIRSHIFENPEAYRKIINAVEFKKYFPEIYGEKLKLPPKGFPRDFAGIEWLKHKHYAVTCRVSNSFWVSKSLNEKLIEIFKVQYAFNHFLNEAVSA